MHSHLLVGGSESQRANEAKKLVTRLLNAKAGHLDNLEKIWLGEITFPDLIIFTPGEKLSLGIETSREIKEFLGIKPFEAAAKVVVILEAQSLTLEAQNALLKTLEEPPARSFVILAAPHEKLLLPTIVSRCLVKRMAVEPSNTRLPANIKELLSCSYGRRLDFFEKNEKTIARKEDFVKLIDDCLIFTEDYLSFGLKEKNLQGILGRLLKLKKELIESRTSPRVLAEICFLELPEKIIFPN